MVGLALGSRAPRLAHRVLGDGGEAARAGRSRSTAAGSTSSSPTTRTSWRSRGRSGTSSRRSGCTTACSASPARRCRSRSATSRRSRRCSTAGVARATAPLLPHRALAQPDRLLRRDDGGGAGAVASFRRRSRGSSARPCGPAGRRFAGGARRRLQHAGALAVLHEWRRQASSSSSSGRSHVFGLGFMRDADAPDEMTALVAERAGGARSEGLRGRRTGCATEIDAAGGSCATTPAGSGLVREA